MTTNKPMSPWEKRMFKESVIREYKLKYEKKKNAHYHHVHHFLGNLKRIVRINIVLGIIASIIVIYQKGWSNFFNLVLTGIIWITIISTTVAALSKKKAK